MLRNLDLPGLSGGLDQHVLCLVPLTASGKLLQSMNTEKDIQNLYSKNS